MHGAGKIRQIKRCGCENFRRIQPPQQGRQRIGTQAGSFKHTGGDIDPRRPQIFALLGLAPARGPSGQHQQQIRAAGFKQFVLCQGAGRYQPHHSTRQRTFGGTPLDGRFGLLGHGHTKTAPDQPREIGRGSGHRHAAHGDRLPPMGAAGCQGDIKS